MVIVGQLVLSSTATGDAWLLDVTDQLAARLARDGDPRSDLFDGGAAIVYADRDTGRVTTILGFFGTAGGGQTSGDVPERLRPRQVDFGHHARMRSSL